MYFGLDMCNVNLRCMGKESKSFSLWGILEEAKGPKTTWMEQSKSHVKNMGL